MLLTNLAHQTRCLNLLAYPVRSAKKLVLHTKLRKYQAIYLLIYLSVYLSSDVRTKCLASESKQHFFLGHTSSFLEMAPLSLG